MAGFKSAARRFQTVLRKANGKPFFGSIQPADEGEITGFDLSAPRLMLRTTAPSIVTPRDVILDELDKRYIVAFNGHSGRGGYFTFRLFPVNADLAWTRQEKTKDPLTGLDRGTSKNDLGTIPCLVEVSSDNRDSGLKVSEETRRIVTSAELELGDMVDDATVRRVETLMGVTYGEIR